VGTIKKRTSGCVIARVTCGTSIFSLSKKRAVV
jgi:hypothetical protein